MISFLDVVFGVIALFLVVRGLFRGLLKEVLSTLGMVGAWWLAGKYGSVVADQASSWFESRGLAELVGYLAVFFGVMLGVKLLTWLVAKILGASPMAWIDMPGGALVGLGKAWLLCCVILAGLLAFMPDAGFISRSMAVPYLRPGADFLREKMPRSMDDFDPAKLMPGPSSSDKEGTKDDAQPGMTDKARELLQKIQESVKDLNKDTKDK